jgi:hypothetical protein
MVISAGSTYLSPPLQVSHAFLAKGGDRQKGPAPPTEERIAKQIRSLVGSTLLLAAISASTKKNADYRGHGTVTPMFFQDYSALKVECV